jgi:hypothetical protein
MYLGQVALISAPMMEVLFYLGVKRHAAHRWSAMTAAMLPPILRAVRGLVLKMGVSHLLNVEFLAKLTSVQNHL